MAPTSQFNNVSNGGILGGFVLILGFAVDKVAKLDYKTLAKICITVIGILIGWAITHWVGFADRLANTQNTIMAAQVSMAKDMGDMKAANAEYKLHLNGELTSLKRCIDEHIAEFERSKK